MVRAIIFDFDGVIHDTLDISYDINKIIDPDLSLEEYKDFFNGNLYKHKEITSEGIKQFFELQTERFRDLRVKEDRKSELVRLKNNHELFILTSNREETLNDYFENNEMTHLFTEVLGVETHRSKEKKFYMIMGKYNLQKEDCLFVTDTLGDILEANNVGINSVAVDYGFHEKERLEKGSPLEIISEFKEISRVVKELSEKIN